MSEIINKFSGANAFLSNFYPCEIYIDGLCYPTAEHAYQASKTTDPVWRERIQKCKTPGIAKRLGKKVPLDNPLWLEDRGLLVMRDIIARKMASKAIRDKLKATGDKKLIEGNSWGDTFWGVCNGKGENNLGKIWMEIRKKWFSQSPN